ncbi:MAG: NFACT family protein [Oscillospiraceae bacterium]|jgi:predicted ribosome quality control (RQC) complex YloA/Tae2 family protein|nr:NFACT family protein [Oscillospiraceae bacterium]
MPLDAICLSAVLAELRPRVVGSRIDKLQQPERDELILTLRGDETVKLLISVGAGDARLHLTETAMENPAQPPMFCMLLRKHLTGARVISLEQEPCERVVTFTLKTSDAMGDPTEKRLILELMGRNSNIILADEDGRVIDCVRRVDEEMSARRQVLPGLFYRLPPPQEKRDPFATSRGEFFAELTRANQGKTIDAWLLDTFTAISPLIARELSYRAYGDIDARLEAAVTADNGEKLYNQYNSLITAAKALSFTPTLLHDASGKPSDFSYTDITQYGALYTVSQERDFSALLESYYTKRANETRARQRGSALSHSIKNARSRTARKLEAQRAELTATQDREFLRQSGDIIMANLHVMRKGQSLLRAEDFYGAEEGAEREIRLNPLKTPQENAAKYYKEYTKAKTAEAVLNTQISAGERELAYLDSVLQELATAETERDLAEIRRELEDTGYIKAKKPDKGAKKSKPSKKPKSQASSPREYRTASGQLIRVGRNNTQNDELTKSARYSDVWFHVQKRHGSHVILTPEAAASEADILEAAAIAAYYSEARDDTRVAVDYCSPKNVKKPSGARPGMVIYNEYKTVIVAPRSPDDKLTN